MLQPHKRSSETRMYQPIQIRNIMLQPHKRSSETPTPLELAPVLSRFNRTSVRLKRSD